jgi:hypothetical protein
VDPGTSLAPASYTYTYALEGQWGVGALTLSTGSILTVSASANPQTVNPGQTVDLTSNASGGTPPYAFTWSPPFDVASPTSQNTTASPIETVTFSLTVTDSQGQSSKVKVPVLVNLTLSVSSNPTFVAPQQPTQLIAMIAGGMLPYTIGWMPAAALNDPNIFNPVATPNVTTTFQVTVTDSATPPAQTTGSIQVPVALTVAANASPASIQAGSSSTLTAVVEGGLPPYTYSWTPTTGLNQANIAGPIASPSSTTEYQLDVTDSSMPPNSGHASATVAVNSAVLPPVASFSLTWLDSQTLRADASSSTGSVPITLYEWWPDWVAGENDCVADAPVCVCFFTAGNPFEGCSQSPDPTDGSPEPWLYEFFGTPGSTVQLTIKDADGNTATVTKQVPPSPS